MMDKTCSEKDRLIEDLNNSKGIYFRLKYYLRILTNNLFRTYISEQISKLENDLKNLIQEAGKKVKFEVENVRTMYKNKLREANTEIEVLRAVCIIIIFVTII